MTAAAHKKIIATAPRDRLDLFLATANRLGAPVGDIEKDFWVRWTVNAHYNERPAGGPRLLFKGFGTPPRFNEILASAKQIEDLANSEGRGRGR